MEAKSKIPKTPHLLKKALRKNKKAKMAFEKMPPSHKREYIEYISEAKKEETKQKRIKKVMRMMGSG